MIELEQELLANIKTLNSVVWDGSVDYRTIEEWLKGFGEQGEPGSSGRAHALYLLSRFMYFGDYEVRGLLKALFRDHYKYPIVSAIRRAADNTTSQSIVRFAFDLALRHTRFLGVGNPSESGTHLLYHYRQENSLAKDLFISPDEIFRLGKQENQPTTLRDPSVTRYIFIDDFCGSGQQ